MGMAMVCIDQNSKVPGRGERVATFVEDYLTKHAGLSLGELAFRLHADKRDLQRLLRDRSIGHALEDALAAYFGPIFGQAVWGDLWGSGPSKREKELERERAELAARRERLERLRAADREAAADARDRRRLAADQDRTVRV
jgi:plasmid maintenance system antidote protein VapI